MGRCNGTVLINDKPVAYFIWNGTADCVWNGRLFDTPREPWDDYNTPGIVIFRHCTCGQPATPVTLHNDYGSGHKWPGSVCLHCRAIVTGRDWEREDTETIDC